MNKLIYELATTLGLERKDTVLEMFNDVKFKIESIVIENEALKTSVEQWETQSMEALETPTE